MQQKIGYVNASFIRLLSSTYFLMQLLSVTVGERRHARRRFGRPAQNELVMSELRFQKTRNGDYIYGF